jgi:hypothetical protein
MAEGTGAGRGLIKELTPKRLKHEHPGDLISVVRIEPVSGRLGHTNGNRDQFCYSHLTPDAGHRLHTSRSW